MSNYLSTYSIKPTLDSRMHILKHQSWRAPYLQICRYCIHLGPKPAHKVVIDSWDCATIKTRMQQIHHDQFSPPMQEPK
jgi:hypothetical protein